jgi:Capsule polysaccharide biosynthesis protein
LKTFIIPGELPHLARIQDDLTDEVCGILIHNRMTVESVRAERVVPDQFADRLYTLRSLDELTTERPAEWVRERYEQCLARLYADQRTQFLASRAYFNSAFNNSIAIEKMVLNSLSIIAHTQPTRMVAGSTPHSLGAWVLAKCFEYLGLPVYVLERTPINNRVWIYQDLDRQEVVELGVVSDNVALSDAAVKLLQEQRRAEPGARDARGFYLSRMDLGSIKGADSNVWWSYARELGYLRHGRLISLPVRLFSSYFKKMLLRSYKDVAVTRLPETPFVIFFMHYQPERTSLPEGLHFVQQWLAIRLISWALPAGWKLLVREHPSMWLNQLDITVRTPDIYPEIAALPNVGICAMEIDTFEVIDKSTAVATLTGSVGFQALLRNRPVIAFGLPAYKDHAGCFNVSSLAQLIAALEVIASEDMSERFSDAALTRYLHWIESNSYCVDPSEPDWLEARLKNFAEIYRWIFRGQLSLPASAPPVAEFAGAQAGNAPVYPAGVVR